MTEAKFQAEVIKYLKRCGVQVFKYPGLITAGVPDLLCNVDGKFVALELKVGKYQPTALQIKTMHEIRNKRGFAFVFRHSDNWEQELQNMFYFISMLNITHNHHDLAKMYPLPDLPKDVIV